jgi:hypothetical protein
VFVGRGYFNFVSPCFKGLLTYVFLYYLAEYHNSYGVGGLQNFFVIVPLLLFIKHS